ncbi:MAG: L,D-transpeptidase family protein [Chthoniobacterales bacterium]
MVLAGCAQDKRHVLVISVPDQRMVVLEDGAPIAAYPVSTSKYGIGDAPGSYRTPGGTLKIAKKFGDSAPPGTVLKNRRPTGEVLAVDAPGRDPVVTRILWLKGLEPANSHAYARNIYIHGTPEERNIGRPASYGCIRMRSHDIIELFDIVGTGARVKIVTDSL